MTLECLNAASSGILFVMAASPLSKRIIGLDAGVVAIGYGTELVFKPLV